MKLHLISEPKMEFGSHTHICPRGGISQFAVYDSRMSERRDTILVGAVGTSESLDKLNAWLARCASVVPTKPNNRQPNLYPSFCGFNKGLGFKAQLVIGTNITRQIHNSDMDEVLSISDAEWNRRAEAAVELYYEKVKFLSQNRATVDVIVCVLPDELYEKLIHKKQPSEQTLDDDHEQDDVIEMNFRRALKARSMHLGKPLQLVRESALQEKPKGQQDDATRAWNFCTALYYKANKTVPWRLIPNENRSKVCFVGIGFYRSRDYQVLNTSLAQIFDELGNGVILRGTPVDMNKNKNDRRPYMDEQQAYELLKRALHEYDIALETPPGRLVLHKSSKFHEEELSGFTQAIKESNVRASDFVTILDSRMRLLRDGAYPPYRGTHLEIDRGNHVLYTRGAVQYYKTYPGHYPPQPLDIRITKADESPNVICSEILSLTKMNWNNTQFDGKYPITLQCARNVGDIMKYLEPHDGEPQISYSYYM